MGRVSQWAVRRPVYALLTWIGIMVASSASSGRRFGGDYNDNFELPDTESTTAQDLLPGPLRRGAAPGPASTARSSGRPDSGKATEGAAGAP